MDFQSDLFISYAHLDNQNPDGEGWVTKFEKNLKSFLGIKLGEHVKIWRDDSLKPIDIFDPKIMDALSTAAVLISIVSPGYLNSQWCLREVEEFSQVVGAASRLAVAHKSRVIRIMVEHFTSEERDMFPPVLKDTLGYDFYTEVSKDDYVILDPDLGYKEAYKRNVCLLAGHVAKLLKDLRSSVDVVEFESQLDEKQDEPRLQEKVGHVYLAETGYDQRDNRERIKGELLGHGYKVLPDDKRMSDIETDYVHEVNELLDKCQISVHLVGMAPGKIPDGPSQKSVVEIQNELAAEKSEGSGLKRLIWLPQGMSSQQASHQEFIDAIHRVAALQRGADLVTGDLESLKGVIHSTLRKIEEPANDAPVVEEKEMVYLICLDDELDALSPILQCCKEKGFKVKLPVFSGDAAAVRQANERFAKASNRCLVFWGDGDGAWHDHQKVELEKLRGTQPASGSLPVWWYLHGPVTPDKKKTLLLDEPNVIDGLSGFSPGLMDPFLKGP